MACGAMNEQGYDSENNAQSEPGPIGRLAANGIRITDTAEASEVFVTGGDDQITYLATADVQGPDQAHVAISALSSVFPLGLSANNVPVESSDYQFGQPVDLTSIVTDAGIACEGFDYSGGRNNGSGALGFGTIARLRVERVDFDATGYADPDKLSLTVGFDVVVPLRRPYRDDDCVPKSYTFFSKGVLSFEKPIYVPKNGFRSNFERCRDSNGAPLDRCDVEHPGCMGDIQSIPDDAGHLVPITVEQFNEFVGVDPACWAPGGQYSSCGQVAADFAAQGHVVTDVKCVFDNSPVTDEDYSASPDLWGRTVSWDCQSCWIRMAP